MIPKVSIIIPVYNAAEFVEKCLKNCLLQTMRTLEVIVVDDKSTDNTVEIVQSVIEKDKRVKLIQLEKNSRQGYARNVGIQHAKADYIMFLDVDDGYENDCVELMYKKITEDDADMTVCKFYTLDYKTMLVETYHDFKNYADISENLYSGFCYKDLNPYEIFNKCNVVWDKIYKKSFILDNNITFPGGMYCEDDVFSFKAFFRAKKITVLDKYLVYYRVNRDNSSSVIGDETAFDCFRMMKLIRDDLLDLEIYYELYNAIVAYSVEVCLYFYGLVKKRLKKEFYNKMKKTLCRYWGYLDEISNQKYFTITYDNLEKIIYNNYYSYEIITFWERLKTNVKNFFQKED
ncbi:MAG: glycosyltransferase family 2 protein [Candidatus Gastranaerophilales bacterium]|nr:glycosyltransferase family 2 protein [Candidatus Gastranaerophilales bacterium]